MTDTMIERVAKAISGCGVTSKSSLRKAAAAIKAMREPSEEMVKVGLKVIIGGSCEDTYTAMIDAALSQ